MNLYIIKDITKKENVPYDIGHGQRVAKLSIILANNIGLGEKYKNDIYTAALNHDNGKQYCENDILFKPGKLTKGEFEIIKYHVIYSTAEALEKGHNLRIIRSIYFHHENFDGTGYPGGLVGKNIPLGARIIRICDFYDALISYRTYRKCVYTKDEAIRIMGNNINLLDPTIFEIFKMIMLENNTIGGK